MDRYRKLLFICLAVAGVVAGCLLGPGRAAADFQFNIDSTNASSLGTGPYGTVTVTNITSTSALVTITAASGFGFVDGSSLALNVAAGVTTSNAVITLTSFGSPETLTLSTGNSNIDGLGHFNVIYDQQDSSSPAVVEKVTLTGTGFSASNLSTILVGNDDGFLAEAHIAVLASNGQSNGSTGFEAGNGVGPNDNPTAVPAPPSLVLALSAVGVSGLIAITRRARRKAVVLGAVS